MAASCRVTSLRPSASAIGSSNLRLQPDERSDISLAPGYPIGAAGLVQAGGSLKTAPGIPLGPPTCGQVFSRPGGFGGIGRKRRFDASPSPWFRRLQHFPDGLAGDYPIAKETAPARGRLRPF